MTIRTERFRLRGVHSLYDPHHREPKHGHEYFLEVSVPARCPRAAIVALVGNRILSVWDKKDWNQMGVAQASGELLVEEFDRLLRADLGDDLVAVVLQETPKNRFLSGRSSLAYGE